MARFSKGDSIEQLKYGKTIRRGIVVDGPFKAEGVDHYHVKWNWYDKLELGNLDKFIPEVDLISDLRSAKYMYI